jgi:Ca2+-transporting ATPase
MRSTGRLLAQANALAAQGLRVLAWRGAAIRSACPTPMDADDLESQLELLGLIGLIDPPRPEARPRADCLRPGITPVMITGDHPATALAIAHRLGIVDVPTRHRC